MREEVIIDTSCLIILKRIGRLEILKEIYERVIIPVGVKEEFGEELPEWIEVEGVKDEGQVKVMEMYVGRGEAEVLVLGLERGSSLVVIDDRKGRRLARGLGLRLSGTIGVIIRAKEAGEIGSVKGIIEELEGAGFRLSESLKRKALELAGEI